MDETKDAEILKPFWTDMKYDLDGGTHITRIAERCGNRIRQDFQDIQECIQDFDLRSALDLIQRAKKEY